MTAPQSPRGGASASPVTTPHLSAPTCGRCLDLGRVFTRHGERSCPRCSPTSIITGGVELLLPRKWGRR